jgi:hypothetical protein
MKKKIFVVMFLTAGAFLFSQNAAPLWYTNKELQYPSHRYIAAVGEGKTRSDAEARAVAVVSLFFNTRTDVRNEVIKEFNEAVTNNTTAFLGKTYAHENAVIRSETEFLGIHFAPSWQDSKTKQWAALAYIERKEAAEIYESRIESNLASINTLVQDAEREGEVFYVCALLSKAISIGNITEELVKIAVMVDSGARGKYALIPVQIESIRTKYRSLRDSLSFDIQASGTNNTGRIELTLRELFEQQGFVISHQSPTYHVSTKLTMNEEKGTEFFFARPGLTVNVERAGKTLFSYTKNYSRVSHSTPEGAYNRGIIAVEEDLKDNFIKQLTASIGR